MNKEALSQLWQLAFGDEQEWIDLFFETAYALERCRWIQVDGQLAAALYWLDSSCDGNRLAYIYAVATHPDYRGRGLCRRLMMETHRDLQDMGYAGAIVVPAEVGLREMYGKMGYEDFSGVREFDCGAGEPLPLRRVTAEEYGALRRTLLPEHGVLQEGEHLRLLAATADLYAGDDFLVAVSRAEHFFATELLGDPTVAPGILGALGAQEGRFRTVGDAPFGMVCRFRPDLPLPGHFGLAFD